MATTTARKTPAKTTPRKAAPAKKAAPKAAPAAKVRWTLDDPTAKGAAAMTGVSQGHTWRVEPHAEGGWQVLHTAPGAKAGKVVGTGSYAGCYRLVVDAARSLAVAA
jgi:hypothetical protein